MRMNNTGVRLYRTHWKVSEPTGCKMKLPQEITDAIKDVIVSVRLMEGPIVYVDQLAMKALESAILSAIEGKWTPCSEKLPPADEPYITCSETGTVRQLRFSQNYWYDGHGFPVSEIVAWRPLPEPYEVKK